MGGRNRSVAWEDTTRALRALVERRTSTLWTTGGRRVRPGRCGAPGLDQEGCARQKKKEGEGGEGRRKKRQLLSLPVVMIRSESHCASLGSRRKLCVDASWSERIAVVVWLGARELGGPCSRGEREGRCRLRALARSPGAVAADDTTAPLPSLLLPQKAKSGRTRETRTATTHLPSRGRVLQASSHYNPSHKTTTTKTDVGRSRRRRRRRGLAPSSSSQRAEPRRPGPACGVRGGGLVILFRARQGEWDEVIEAKPPARSLASCAKAKSDARRRRRRPAPYSTTTTTANPPTQQKKHHRDGAARSRPP